jgi:hypothetical protein
MLCRPSSLADALLPFFTSGCFDAVVVLVVDCSGGRFATLVYWLGGCFATFEFKDLMLS